MRVLFCQTVPYMPDDHGGGLTNTDALCRALQMQGCEPLVLCRDGSKNSLPWPFSKPRNSFPYQVLRSRDPLGALDSVCASVKPDIAIVQFADSAQLVAGLKQHDVPTIVYQHDAFAAASVAAGADRYFACSGIVAGAMPRDLGVPIDVMPVLIDPEQYRVARNGAAVTLFNPIPRKGVEIAFALAARRPDLTFELVEAWQLRGRVRTYLQQRVAHHGNMLLRAPAEDMRAIYGRTRLILAPSLGLEAWGRIVSEAHVSGIPALVSDSGGLPEAAGPGGLVVARNAPIAKWSDALDHMLEPESYEQFSAAALTHAARPDFQPAAIVARFMNALKEHRR